MGQRKSFHADLTDRKNRYHGLQRMPLTEVCGRRRILIENHIGILSYGTQEILIKVDFGCIQVLGNGLRIAKICKEKLVISGTIYSLNFQGRG